MSDATYTAAIDVGAANGAKIALFRDPTQTLFEADPSGRTGEGDFEVFSASVGDSLERSIASAGLDRKALAGIGISAAGILTHEGAFHLIHNRPGYNGRNLKTAMEERFGVPAAIANDADAGAVAEWEALRVELLYWVFGGGWGGAWVGEEGAVRFPTVDWDGDDASLHPTSEPGYSIGLEKMKLRLLFREVGASFELFEHNFTEDPSLPADSLAGPGGDPMSLRAEVVLSGPGRCRLFRAITGDEDFYERFLDIHEIEQMTDPAVAGKPIDKLSRMRVEAAVNTDRLYGKILAEATRILVKRASADGLPEGIPICLGGKPSYALPYFGPSAQRRLGRLGVMSYLRPSVQDERGTNANLVGAAVLADRAARANGNR